MTETIVLAAVMFCAGFYTGAWVGYSERKHEEKKYFTIELPNLPEDKEQAVIDAVSQALKNDC